MKKVTIFGSTGSIGTSALEIIRGQSGKFRVQGLCANNNINLLKKQIREFKPGAVCLADETRAGTFKKDLPRGIKFFSGANGLEDFSSLHADIAVMGISGIACLRPLLAALASVPVIALANKEAMVCAAGLVKSRAAKHKARLLPVDSEINALFQLMPLVSRKALEKVYLTASGGALFDYSRTEIKKAKARDVLAHPTWRMGRRITVDSATLVNKGFEVIEAHEFFDLDYSEIDIVIHRESVAHAFIKSRDGIYFSCMYDPDMKLPLAHALAWPERIDRSGNGDLFPGLGKTCTFMPVDPGKFPLLGCVLEAAAGGDNALVVLNASDEVAIDYFLQGRITFAALCRIVMKITALRDPAPAGTLKEIFFWDSWARQKTKEYIEWKY